jgi:hypothetical protein
MAEILQNWLNRDIELSKVSDLSKTASKYIKDKRTDPLT